MADANATPQDTSDQFLRQCTLIVSDRAGKGLDLSQLRIKFAVKRTDTSVPNTADIRVYNLEENTALTIRKEFTKVVLQAGYIGNESVIFQGNIRQVILGRENATDTYIDIVAGDGDRAYNFAIVNTTLAKGSTPMDQVSAASDAMSKKGVTTGHLGDMPKNQLPRGKVMYGNAKKYLSNVASTNDKVWSIQNNKINFVPQKGYLPGTAVVLTNETGIVGIPQQTNDGVNVKCLLNPKIQVSGLIKIDNKSVIQQKLNLEQIAAAKGNTSTINGLTPRHLSADGTYYVLVLEYQGDTRGTDWYCNIIGITQDASANPINSVQPGYGG